MPEADPPKTLELKFVCENTGKHRGSLLSKFPSPLSAVLAAVVSLDPKHGHELTPIGRIELSQLHTDFFEPHTIYKVTITKIEEESVEI